MSPHIKAVNHSCLLSFPPSSVFTQPVAEHFDLGHVTPFWIYKLYRLLQHRPMLEGEGDLTILLPFAGPLPRELSPNSVAVRGLWQHRAESQHLDSLFGAHFPAPVLGPLPYSTPPFFLQLQGSWDHAVPTRDSVLLCHLNTFKPGMYSTVVDP